MTSALRPDGIDIGMSCSCYVFRSAYALQSAAGAGMSSSAVALSAARGQLPARPGQYSKSHREAREIVLCNSTARFEVMAAGHEGGSWRQVHWCTSRRQVM